ncbi:MAG: cyclase family protein [Clostridia bacterium]|nr:cyclase family protein [Clostridia bacterium]
MKIYDISMMVEPDIMVYKDNPAKKPVFKNAANHAKDNMHETRVDLDIHCGTHIDMPLHMIEDGKTMDDFDFTRLYMAKAKVYDMTGLEKNYISAEDIELLDIEEGDFVIFKTVNSFYDKSNGFDNEFVFVDESAAKFLTDKKINGAGIDALGIERSQPSHMTHKLLLGADIIILEGLELKSIEPGEYKLTALPIKLKGTEGSWVRAVLSE